MDTSQTKNSLFAKNEKELIFKLDSLFIELNQLDVDKSDYTTDELKVDINEKIRRVIENINSNELLMALDSEYDKKNHSFSFVLSPDGKVGIFSWHTLLEASGNTIKNIAIHQKNNKVAPTSLYGDPIIYNRIYELKSNKGQTVYLIHGQNKELTNSYQRLNSYILRDGNLEAYTSFPNNVSFISTQLASQNNQPDIFEVVDRGSKIIFQSTSNTLSEDYSLNFDGKKFVYNSFED